MIKLRFGLGLALLCVAVLAVGTAHADNVVTSVERGFYDQAFDVDVASQIAGATLVYTTDGTEPSLTNGTQVQPANANEFAFAVIRISSTTSLRAAALLPGVPTTGSTTHTYVFLDDVIASDVMDTNITQDPRYENLLRDGLLSIPSVSLNFDNEIEDSFTPQQASSIEFFPLDGSEGFQASAGIRAFGGFFTDFDKKSFRLNFGGDFGDGDVDFPLFEGSDNGENAATDSFRQLEFRSGSHDMSQRGFYHSNRFTDDSLLDAGHFAPNGRFVHVYLNGTYWGQYHMRERWNDDFLSQYHGGDNDDYEAVNGNVNNGNNTPGGWSPGEVYDGTGEAWDNINNIVNANNLSPSQRFDALRQTVDLNNYLDFMLIYMAGASENEYRCGGSSDGSVPFTFYINDADGWIRDPLQINNRQGRDKTADPGPANILGRLVEERDPEFLTLYADRTHRIFGEGGVLSPERAIERLQERLDEVELSFLLESARWGERTPDSYRNAADNALQNLLPNMASNTLTNLRSRNIITGFDAPTIQIDGASFNGGGEITAGAELSFSADQTVYYTTDGSDPRLVGGSINPNAIAFDSGLSTTSVFDFGSVWNFLDDGSNQGTAWRSPNFDDSQWSSGAGELGYGDGDETTVVDDGDPNGNNRHITTYFRRTFDVEEDATDATLTVRRDDGVAVYLNGNLVGVDNLDVGAAFDDTANGAGEEVNVVFTVELQAGSNTLAIEIHQASGSSSDISFDAGLTVSKPTSTSSQPIILNSSTNVQARSFLNGEWSGVSDATFVIPGPSAPQSDLRISEVHYNPADPSDAEIAAEFIDNDDFEFIELYNPSTIGTINLDGVQFSDGVIFDFGDHDLLPGQRVVVVEDEDAFMARYGDSATVLGQWSGRLSNNGEQITLSDSSLNVLDEVIYQDVAPWADADGSGLSLNRVNPATDGNLAASWRAASPSPGVAPPAVLLGDVNQDGIVDFNDIAPFISVLSNSEYLQEADLNEDGVVNFNDISFFIAELN